MATIKKKKKTKKVLENGKIKKNKRNAWPGPLFHCTSRYSSFFKRPTANVNKPWCLKKKHDYKDNKRASPKRRTGTDKKRQNGNKIKTNKKKKRVTTRGRVKTFSKK